MVPKWFQIYIKWSQNGPKWSPESPGRKALGLPGGWDPDHPITAGMDSGGHGGGLKSVGALGRGLGTPRKALGSL